MVFKIGVGFDGAFIFVPECTARSVKRFLRIAVIALFHGCKSFVER